MKVYDYIRQTNSTFEQLEKGDCFYCDGCFFMKLDCDPGNYNAICFNDNRLYYFFEKNNVEKVKGKLNIYPMS